MEIILIIQPTCTNFLKFYFGMNSTYFRQFLCPSSGVSHRTHSNGTCHTGLWTAFEQDQDGTSGVSHRTHSNGIHHTGLWTAFKSCPLTCMTYTLAVCTVRNS
jgi:hypothetical protein